MSKNSRHPKIAEHHPLLDCMGFGQSNPPVFSDPDQMIGCLMGLAKLLKRGRLRDRGQKGLSAGLFLETIQVEFATGIREVSVKTELASSAAVILAPILSRESSAQRHSRRVELLKSFLPAIRESQLRTLLQLYRSLSLEARNELIERLS